MYMNKLNLYEVYYDILRSGGEQQNDIFCSHIYLTPINVVNGISDLVCRKAAQLKVKYKISLADSIALGQAFVLGASLLTSDHHEFDEIEREEDIHFSWIR